jgi:putative ABC transport system substrate-binding protein
MKTIGFLGAASPSAWSTFVTAFERRLRKHGLIDGYNIDIDDRWANGQKPLYDRIATEFVWRDVDVIVTSGVEPTLSAMKATSDIPIVFAALGDPALVKSDNVTGSSNAALDLVPDRVAFLAATVGWKNLAIIGNEDATIIKNEMDAVEAEAGKNLNAAKYSVKTKGDITKCIRGLKPNTLIYVCSDPLLSNYRDHISEVSLGAGLVTMTPFREYAEAGAFMSYGPRFVELFRRAADFVHMILSGKSPADIPVETPSNYELVYNSQTAETLKIVIPGAMLARANTII